MPVDSAEGRTLGKYRVLEPLGRGGMARVYRAYHPQLDRFVAIKVLRSDLVEEEEFLLRFKREAQAVAALRHPNIVQVFDFDVDQDAYYMVMELLEGDTLRSRLNDYAARSQRMPLGEVTRILLDTLDALAYAHKEGMIHRDVKPANILLTRRGQAVLTDFGIAQIVGGTRYTVHGALMGTLAYMAPEQGLEGECDARSDLYSLGIVLYEMLTGDPPFDAETPLAILMKHVNDPLPPPRRIEPSLPRPLERVVLKTLSKRPQDRYQSAEEMAQALRKATKKARIELPEQSALPVLAPLEPVSSGSVAVLSGTARDQVDDIEFAVGDTDARLGQHLAEEAEARAQASRAGAVPDRDSDTAKAAGAHQSLPQANDASQPSSLSFNSGPMSLLPFTLGLLPGANLLAVLFGLITGWWGVFGRGWPFELLLVGLVISQTLIVTHSVWLTIPIIVILGNGFLLSFYSLTNLWRWWAFLWPLEPMIILGSVLLAISLSNQGKEGRHTAVRLAQSLRRPTLIFVPILMIVGAILG